MPVPGTISGVTRFTAPWTGFVSRIMFSVDLSPRDLLSLGPPTKAKQPQYQPLTHHLKGLLAKIYRVIFSKMAP